MSKKKVGAGSLSTGVNWTFLAVAQITGNVGVPAVGRPLLVSVHCRLILGRFAFFFDFLKKFHKELFC